MAPLLRDFSYPLLEQCFLFAFMIIFLNLDFTFLYFLFLSVLLSDCYMLPRVVVCLIGDYTYLRENTSHRFHACVSWTHR